MKLKRQELQNYEYLYRPIFNSFAMRNILSSLVAVFALSVAQAQVPAGYYNSAAGLKGQALKTQLSSIITSGHQDHGYGGLYNGYPTTDPDNFFEDDGSVLDMYSEDPAGTDPYNFTHGQKKCGNYSKEGDCYNREHIVPQSLFNENSPMRNDINFIRPTDGKVNGFRSNYPFGPVTVLASSQSGITNPTKNGSKLGTNPGIGYGGTIFEPIDAFKGDVARMVFYFVTRYESRLSSFSTGNMLGGSSFPGLQAWELNVLMAWHKADPVSTEEMARNNASYVFQGNRNPFIDHPEYVDVIWGASANDATAPTAPATLASANITYSSAALSWSGSSDNVDVLEYNIYVNGILKKTVSKTSTTLYSLTPETNYSVYVTAKDFAGNVSPASTTINFTTPVRETVSGALGGFENFDDFTIGTTSMKYTNRSWTNNGVTWNAQNARVDQKIADDMAICLKNGKLTSSVVPNGIGSFTVTTQSKFGKTSGTYNLVVNGVVKASIPYAEMQITTTINDINVAGNVVIELVDANPSGTNRVAFDNLTWTTFSALAVHDVEAASSLKVYPNPVTQNELYLTGLKGAQEVEIYNLNGQLVQKIGNVKENQKISVSRLAKGVYILRTKNQTAKIIID